MSTFSHLNAGGEANMVDVSDKDVTKREATAEGFLYVSEDVIRQISESKIAKGDVFAVARVAGIQGAKRCADLIPLCSAPALLSEKRSLACSTRSINAFSVMPG